MDFDQLAEQTIQNLCRELNLEKRKLSPILSPYSIGVETEVKFRYYFPDIHHKFFTHKKWVDYSIAEREEINQVITEAERTILPSLEKTVSCGIPKGLDKYWEFALTPVYDTALLIQQIDLLQRSNLIPPGQHSFHITIGGLSPNRYTYWLLAYLELLFINKERIEAGFSKIYTQSSDTWAKKGYGGLLIKNHHDLTGQAIGTEFRTLMLPDTNFELARMFTILVKFLVKIKNQEEIPVLDQLALSYEKLGLPDKNWQKPHMEPEIWRSFINHFEELQEIAINLENYENY